MPPSLAREHSVSAVLCTGTVYWKQSVPQLIQECSKKIWRFIILTFVLVSFKSFFVKIVRHLQFLTSPAGWVGCIRHLICMYIIHTMYCIVSEVMLVMSRSTDYSIKQSIAGEKMSKWLTREQIGVQRIPSAAVRLSLTCIHQQSINNSKSPLYTDTSSYPRWPQSWRGEI